MVGKRFGRWTVVSFSRKGKHGELYWNCRCDCGEEKEVVGYSLRRGRSTSCGCWLIKKWKEREIVGKRFGRLVCLCPSKEQNKWECVCDCGNKTIVATYPLVSGTTRSCGCMQRESISERNTRKRVRLAGQRFGRLVVLEDAEQTKNGASMCLCLCDCGNQKLINAHSLRSGDTTSCGCKNKKYGVSKKGENARLMRIWDGMKDRCLKENDKSFANYGGRGISVCNEWKVDFWAFCNWSRENGYGEDLQIDRIDCNGPYSPENCRWVTPKENARNRRNNRNLTALGRTQCISAWAEEIGLSPSTVRRWITKHDQVYAEKRLTEYVMKKHAWRGDIE